MGFLAAALPAIASIGGGVTGALANRRSARTSTSSFDRTGQSNYSNTGQRILTGEQQTALPQLGGYITKLLTDPSAGLGQIRTGQKNAVNQNYQGFEEALRKKFRTQGQSGKFGSAALAGELGRIGGLNDVDAQMAQATLGQQNLGAQLAQQLIGQSFGQHTSGGTQDRQFGSGENVGAGDALSGGLTGGLQGLMAMLAMQQVLSGGGGRPYNGLDYE